MNQSKIYFVYTLLFALTLSQQTLPSTRNFTPSQETSSWDKDDFDTLFDIEPDDIDDAKTQELVEQTPIKLTRDGEQCSPQDTIDMLFGLAPNLSQVLQEDIYCHTNPINIRSLLDMPLFSTRLFHPPHAWYASADLFWNESNRANFTKESNHISSYLALANEELFKMLPTACDQYTMTIFPVLANGRLEERRVGGMLQAGYAWDRFTLRGMTPLYYLERNYQLTQEEKDALMVQFGETTEDEQERFQKDHLISDKFGFGDLRLYGEFNIIKKPTCNINMGPLVTLPTAFALVKDIMGSTFKPCKKRPVFNAQELCACGDLTSFTVLGYQAIDNLSALILEEQLGNRRHLGLGGFIDWQQRLSTFIGRPWTEHISLKNTLSFEYLVPNNEPRYFIRPANPADYNRRNFEDESQAADNLLFLETELINTLFPFNYTTRVHPGCVVWWDAQMAYQGDRLGISTGLDFWFHSKEKLSRIQSCGVPCNELAVATAHAPVAYQLKALGSLSYTLTRPTHQWVMGFGADKTFIRAGIGKDYTVNAFLRASF